MTIFTGKGYKLMKCSVLSCAVFFLTAGLANAGQIIDQSFTGTITKTVSLKYAIYLPDGYEKANSKTEYPLILFLHGAEYRGNDISKILDLGPLRYAKEHPGFPFMVVAPLCPAGKQWEPDELIALLDYIEKKYRVQKSAVYITGYSMGGAGTWATAMKYPERFAAVAPLCGRLIPLLIGNLWQTPVWVFHGDKDDVVPFAQSEEAVKCLEGMGNKNVRFKVFPNRGHDIWHDVYESSELYSWFMQFRKDSRSLKTN
jgi:predicted peptidase